MSGGITEDGEVEFSGNRVGSTIVDLRTGRVIGDFGQSARSPNGAWEVQFPNLAWNDDAPRDILLRNGMDGRTVGKLKAHIPDDDLINGIEGAFCGDTRRFILTSDHIVAAYTLPSRKLIEEFPAPTWRDSSHDSGSPTAACSPAGTRVAILDGARLTFHNLP